MQYFLFFKIIYYKFISKAVRILYKNIISIIHLFLYLDWRNILEFYYTNTESFMWMLFISLSKYTYKNIQEKIIINSTVSATLSYNLSIEETCVFHCARWQRQPFTNNAAIKLKLKEARPLNKADGCKLQ